MQRRLSFAMAVLATLLTTLLTPVAALAQSKTLRIVPHTNITILDPIWSSAFVTRNHGYMVYDTLFGTDAEGRIKPQMVQSWSVSPDKKAWTFKLRDGLEFHDGKPVTSQDVVASIKRWASRDSFGGVMARSVETYETPDARTFVVKLKEPFGLMLEALGKPSSLVPFIMPARIAATPGSEQIKEVIGSGPYRFVDAEYRPGERLVYAKNEKYKPRGEPPSGTAGGKNVYVDRAEWVIIRDPQTQYSALLAGEVDIVEMPTFEQYPALKAAKGIRLVDAQPAGQMFYLRFNHLHPPFDNVKIRQAAMVALGQDAVLRTQVGVPGMYKPCKSYYACGTPYSSDNTGIFTGKADPAKARKMLAEAGYKGEKAVLLRPTDLSFLTKVPMVVKQQWEAAGFKVDLQQSDWATVVARRARKDPAEKGGWSAYVSAWMGDDTRNPLTIAMMNASGDKGFFGWQDDKAMQDLMVDFSRAETEGQRKSIAEKLQLRAFETASYVPLGQFNSPAAVRSNVSGIVPAGAQVYWNIRKQ